MNTNSPNEADFVYVAMSSWNLEDENREYAGSGVVRTEVRHVYKNKKDAEDWVEYKKNDCMLGRLFSGKIHTRFWFEERPLV